MNRLIRMDYRQFPETYPGFLHRFQRSGPFRMGPMPLKRAQTHRREIYRWLGYVRAGMIEGDPFAIELHQIANRITWCVEGKGDEAYLFIDKNYLVDGAAADLPQPSFAPSSNTGFTPLTPDEVAAYKRVAAAPPADPYATLRNPDDAADK